MYQTSEVIAADLLAVSSVICTSLTNSRYLVARDIEPLVPYPKLCGTSKPRGRTLRKLKFAAWNLRSMIDRRRELAKNTQKKRSKYCMYPED